ncbi:MAG: glycosyltransferase [Pyrinomonadaceae bacterium]|nr:glycosyltransferase [Pyrinomonadaceae bacterium]
MQYKVSIVIIARNEENAIAVCIKAAQNAADEIGGAEIFLADSASTDKTAEIAKSMGVCVLPLLTDWVLSASAGRFVGSHFAEGDFILFIDADTLVYKGFLPRAIAHLEANPKIAGVNGYLHDTDENGNVLNNIEKKFADVTNIDWLRGPCCFYRATALKAVGSFNPYLTSEEEAELGLRLYKNGWQLQILPFPMAHHTRCANEKNVTSIFVNYKRQFLARRLGGLTKSVGYAFKGGYGLIFCWTRLKTTILFSIWILIMLCGLMLPDFLFPKSIFTLSLLLGIAMVLVKKRSVFETFAFFVLKTLSILNLIVGIGQISFKSPNDYPLSKITPMKNP